MFLVVLSKREWFMSATQQWTSSSQLPSKEPQRCTSRAVWGHKSSFSIKEGLMKSRRITNCPGWIAVEYFFMVYSKKELWCQSTLNSNGEIRLKLTVAAVVKLLSRVQLCDPMDCSLPGSSVGFPRQEYWSGLSFPSPRDLLEPGINHASCVFCIGRRILYYWATWEAHVDVQLFY